MENQSRLDGRGLPTRWRAKYTRRKTNKQTNKKERRYISWKMQLNKFWPETRCVFFFHLSRVKYSQLRGVFKWNWMSFQRICSTLPRWPYWPGLYHLCFTKPYLVDHRDSFLAYNDELAAVWKWWVQLYKQAELPFLIDQNLPGSNQEHGEKSAYMLTWQMSWASFFVRQRHWCV